MSELFKKIIFLKFSCNYSAFLCFVVNMISNRDMIDTRDSLLWDISEASGKYAGRTAMVIEDISYTYGQLFGRVRQIYRELLQEKSNIIGIVAENNIETYASILAVLFAGKTYVMLHPSFPKNRIEQIISDAGIGYTIDNNRQEKAELKENVAPEIIASHQYAYIIFTSGSTGKPKGVPISRENLNAFYSAYGKLGWHLDENDRMLQMFELTFDVSVVSFLYPLTFGAAVYTVSSEGFKYLNVLDVMDTYRITFAAIAPSILRLTRPYFDNILFPDLKYLVVTAEATDVSILSDFRLCIPQATVVNLYGPTESTIYCTSYVIPHEHAKHQNGIAIIGKPFDGIDVMIMDEQGHPVGNGQTGELWVSGGQVMDGYWHDEANSTTSLVRYTDGKVYYKTGDICRRDDDGDLYYYGRKDSQVKIQGFRIELGEIEYQVKQYYGGKVNAVVIPLYMEKGLCELQLVIEKKEESTVGLEQYLQSHLPSYMMPKQIHFMVRFPLNNNGKTDKKRINDLIKNNR